jgi:hypothetical protein
LRVFKKHKHGVIKAFYFPFSKGITAGLNIKIKVIQQVAYGLVTSIIFVHAFIVFIVLFSHNINRKINEYLRSCTGKKGRSGQKRSAPRMKKEYPKIAPLIFRIVRLNSEDLQEG